MIRFLSGQHRVQTTKGVYREVTTMFSSDTALTAQEAQRWRQREQAARRGEAAPFNDYDDGVRWRRVGMLQDPDAETRAVARYALDRYCCSHDGNLYLWTDKGLEAQRDVFNFKPATLPYGINPVDNALPWYSARFTR